MFLLNVRLSPNCMVLESKRLCPSQSPPFGGNAVTFVMNYVLEISGVVLPSKRKTSRFLYCAFGRYRLQQQVAQARMEGACLAGSSFPCALLLADPQCPT
jgi:hypothetical protein